MAVSASSKISGGGFTAYYSTSGPGAFKLVSPTGGSGLSFDTFLKIKTEYVTGAATDIIPLSSKDNTRENTVIEDVEYGVDKHPDSDFSKAAARIFDEVKNGNSDVLP